ncbi:MAG: hypothetical protein NTU84_05860, partial [Verrucomicrobia bacterium]|nr:hypothetical protein [Verrucomicrobiota bacterium]
PRIIHPFDHSSRGIARTPNVFHHALTHGIYVVAHDFLVHCAAPKVKPILQKCQIPTLRAELLDHFIKPRAHRGIKTLELNLAQRLGLENPRPLGLNLTGPDPHLAGSVHQLADKLKLESSLTEGHDPVIRLTQNFSRF